MAHFGVICPPLTGHLNPLAALGRELQSRGHQVTFLQVPELEAKVRSEGLNFLPIGQSYYSPGSLAQSLAHLNGSTGLEALRYAVDFCQQQVVAICEDASGVIQAVGIEVLLVDQLEPAGEAIAQFLDIPFIGVCCAQAIHRRADVPPFFTPWSYQNTWWARLRNQIAYHLLDCTSRPIQQTLNEYRRQWELPIYQSFRVCCSPLAQISQQPAAFDFPHPNLPACFHYTGPLRNPSPKPIPFPYKCLTGQPLIYASLGTLQNTKQEIFHCIAAACAGLDVQLVIAHGGGIDTAAVQALPGSPLVVEYAPQLELLAKAKLTITHGGLNTVLDSLSHGVPLVAIPITHEQPGTGARIKWTGTGEVIPLNRLSMPKLRATIQWVLMEDSYFCSALQIKQAIQQSGGVKRAVNIIEQSLKSGYPALSH